MPINPKHYPKNWKTIAHQIKTDAGWKCQQCDRPCLQLGENPSDFTERIATNRLSECPVVAEYLYQPKRFVLTVAHLDQNPMNSDPENLKALCSVCHLSHDRAYLNHNKLRKRERNGQLTLDLGA